MLSFFIGMLAIGYVFAFVLAAAKNIDRFEHSMLQFDPVGAAIIWMAIMAPWPITLSIIWVYDRRKQKA